MYNSKWAISKKFLPSEFVEPHKREGRKSVKSRIDGESQKDKVLYNYMYNLCVCVCVQYNLYIYSADP